MRCFVCELIWGVVWSMPVVQSASVCCVDLGSRCFSTCEGRQRVESGRALERCGVVGFDVKQGSAGCRGNQGSGVPPVWQHRPGGACAVAGVSRLHVCESKEHQPSRFRMAACFCLASGACAAVVVSSGNRPCPPVLVGGLCVRVQRAERGPLHVEFVVCGFRGMALKSHSPKAMSLNRQQSDICLCGNSRSSVFPRS